jgi:hypothetical protein
MFSSASIGGGITMFSMIKELLNPSRDLFGLTFAELPLKPLNRVAIVLRVIATAIPMTQRHNVGRNGACAILATQWYPVIGGYSVPQSSRSTTHGAAPAEVLKRSLPVLIGVSVRQLLLACFTPVGVDFIDYFPFNGLSPLPQFLLNFIGIVVPISFLFSQFFVVVCGFPLLLLFAYFIAINNISSMTYGITALVALSYVTVGSVARVFLEVLNWEFASACRATLYRCIHSVHPYAVILDVVGRQVDETYRSGINLADMHIIAQGAG